MVKLESFMQMALIRKPGRHGSLCGCRARPEQFACPAYTANKLKGVRREAGFLFKGAQKIRRAVTGEASENA